ncbi:MAG: hypothetical protein U0228_26595 [Myxococcaceae bacterium]
MRPTLFLVLALSALATACQPPPTGCRCNRTNIARATPYTSAATDAGTQVTLVVEVNGKTTVRFERGGHVVVEAFDAVTTP